MAEIIERRNNDTLSAQIASVEYRSIPLMWWQKTDKRYSLLIFEWKTRTKPYI